MSVKVTITKLKDTFDGLLKGDQHPLASTFEFVIPQENVLKVIAGEIKYERTPSEYTYSLFQNQDGVEQIIFASESSIPNPWRGLNKIITIQGSTPNNEPISGWNCDTWTVKEPLQIDGFFVTDVKISFLTDAGNGRFLAKAAIKILDNQRVVFGDEMVTENTGYLLLEKGITTDGFQEIDLVNGKNIDSDGAIVKKIEIIE
jgi:hypothetical protein